MNQLTETLTTGLKPEMAVIVYTNRHDYYIERRDIINGQMMAGTPLTVKCLSGISEVISSDSTKLIHGRIPSFMLFADSRPGKERYIWYRKPEKRRVFFSKQLNIETGEIQFPGIVYMVEGSKLNVFTYKASRLSEKSRLYHAPFFNVYDNGNVCLGNSHLKFPDDLTFEAVVKYWEEKFWRSEFSHLVGGNPIIGNLATETKKCIETGVPFPVDKLRIFKKTRLKDLLNEKNTLR